MRTIFFVAALFIVAGCASVKTNSPAGAEAVVKRLFVDRLNDRQSFNYLELWGLPAIESSLDEPLRTAFNEFKTHWIKAGRPDSPVFAVYARNDPLTMCAVPPANARVASVKEDATRAVFTVTYKLAIDGSPGQYFKSVSTVTLTNKQGEWLVAEASNALYGSSGIKTYTLASRLKELSKLID